MGHSLAQKSAVKGAIVDSEGAVIKKANVLFRTDALERENPTAYRVELRADNKGEFIATLTPGFYDVLIGAPWFAPYCQKVRTREGQSQDLKIVIRIDELIQQEYGKLFSGCQSGVSRSRTDVGVARRKIAITPVTE